MITSSSDQHLLSTVQISNMDDASSFLQDGTIQQSRNSTILQNALNTLENTTIHQDARSIEDEDMVIDQFGCIGEFCGEGNGATQEE